MLSVTTQATKPRRATLADKNVCRMKTIGFGQLCRSISWNKRHKHHQTENLIGQKTVMYVRFTRHAPVRLHRQSWATAGDRHRHWSLADVRRELANGRAAFECHRKLRCCRPAWSRCRSAGWTDTLYFATSRLHNESIKQRQPWTIENYCWGKVALTTTDFFDERGSIVSTIHQSPWPQRQVTWLFHAKHMRGDTVSRTWSCAEHVNVIKAWPWRLLAAVY